MIDLTPNPVFNAAYRAHQPLEVRQLMDEPDLEKRKALAVQLAARGFLIDGWIMVQGQDPWKTMQFRLGYGLPWEPPLGAPPIILSPGPGESVTDLSASPRGAMKNSVDPSDFPPVPPFENQPVAPSVQVKPSSYVGSGPNVFGTYPSLAGDPMLDDPACEGKRVLDPRGVFLAHRNPWGVFYTKE